MDIGKLPFFGKAGSSPRTHLRTSMRYALVGICNTALYNLLLIFCLQGIGLGSFLSVSICCLIVMVFQFSANRLFTFQAEAPTEGQILRYIVTSMLTYLISLLAVVIVSDMFSFSAIASSLVSSASAAVAGYILSYYWVFSARYHDGNSVRHG